MSEAPKTPDNDSKSRMSWTSRQQDNKGGGAPLKTCRNCGMTWKWLHYCPAESKTCNSCDKIGHFARMCRSSTHNTNNNNNENRNPRTNNNSYRNNDDVDSEPTGPYNRKKKSFNRGNNRRQSQDYRDNRGDEKSGNSSPSESSSHGNKNDDNNSHRYNRRQNHNNQDGKNFRQFEGHRGDRRDSKQSETPRDFKDSSHDNKTENSDQNSENNGDNSGHSKSDSQGSARGQRRFQGRNFNRQNYWRNSKTDESDKSDNNGKNYKNNGNETDDKKKGSSYSENSENSGDSRRESRYSYTNVGQPRYNPRKDNRAQDNNAKPPNFSNNNDYSKFNGGGSTSTPGYFYQEQKKHDAIGLKQKLAKSFYQQGNYDAALSHYSRLIEMCPKDPANFNNRSACYMMMGQYENASTDANRVIQLDPSCVKGYSRAIRCAILLGDTTSAELHLAKLSQMYPKNEIIFIERKKLTELQAHFKREAIASKNKNYQNALECINECLLISPHCLSYKIKKAEYLALLKRHNEAQQVLNEILAKDPINVDSKYIMGLRIYHSDMEGALKYFKDILRLDPENSKCLQIYKKAKKIMSTKAAGNDAFRSGNFARAHDIYSTAISIDPDNAPIKAKLSYNMGQASYNLRNYERAIKEYSQALEINPNLTKALKQRGKSYMEIKDYEEAIADFSRACSLEPGSDCQKLIDDAEKLLASVKKDFYMILGVSKDPSIEEVKKAYKDKAMLHHPDRHSNATLEQQKKHERKFKDITLAYRDLLEKCKRKLASAGDYRSR